MVPHGESITASQLLKEDPDRILHWVQAVWAGEQQEPEAFNWLGLAEAAAFSASADLDETWARLAVLVYEHLAETAHGFGEDAYLRSAMYLRIFMIRTLGAVAGDQVRDPAAVLCWFFRGLNSTAEDVVERAMMIQGLSFEEKVTHVAEMQELRHIRNRIAVLKSAIDAGALEPTHDLRAWLGVLPLLP